MEEEGAAARQSIAHLPFKLINVLATTMLRDFGQAGLFGATYLLLMWNLAARPENIASLYVWGIRLVGDALEITFSHNKTDPTGVVQYPRRMFANPQPNEEHTNVFFVVGLYLATSHRTSEQRLFAGSNPQER